MARIDNLTNFLTDVADSIRSKTGKSETIAAEDFDTEIESIETGGGTFEEPLEKDVNFYDYDGTRLYSYTKAEFLNLTAMPDNPEHTGLIAQGWNWDFDEAQNFMQKYPKLIIGQMYITDDGSTRLYVNLEGARLKPSVGFAVNGTATIDWGDGTTPDTVTGTNTKTNIFTEHEYTSGGLYIIKISSDAIIYLKYDYNGSGLFCGKDTTISASYVSIPYRYSIKKIELGNVYIDQNAFLSLSGLNSITTPLPNNTLLPYWAYGNCTALKSLVVAKGITQGISQAINSCTSLKHFILPRGITSYANKFNIGASNLEELILPDTIQYISSFESGKFSQFVIPDSVTSFNGADAVSAHTNLTEIIVKGSITNIYARTFSGNYNVKRYDFSSYTRVPAMANANAFNNIASDCKIVVPDELYDEWIAATNWSNYASYIIKASEE